MADAVRAVARALVAQSQPPGLSLAVEGDAPWSDGFGFADVDRGELADATTAYLWFSMTKIVTATAVVQLAERGALDLDDLVRPWVPEFPDSPRGRRVTIRHLLSHSSGLPNPIPVGWVRPADAPPADPDAFLAGLLRKHSRLRHEPGERAVYSNLGYLVLGAVIERAGGAPYTDYVTANVLTPLGMESTGFSYRPDMADHAATGYHPRFSPLTPVLRRMVPRGIFGHRTGRLWAFNRFCVEGASYGGLVGPVTDAARFVRLHLHPEDPACAGVLSRDGVERMQRLEARGRRLDVGLGWFRRRRAPDPGVPHWEHLGGGGGFFNMLRIHPGAGLGFVTMGNCTSWDQERLAQALTPAGPAPGAGDR